MRGSRGGRGVGRLSYGDRVRPWVLRALVMTAVYGVGQAVFVTARSFAPDLVTLWTLLLFGVLLAVGIVWAGAEVVLGRRPEEWTWFRAALAAAPAAGLLSWMLLALFVDGTGVADLGPALVGRAAFTALLVMLSAFVGSRLGWLSLRRRGEGEDDPMLDRDETDPAAAGARSGSAVMWPSVMPPAVMSPAVAADRPSGAAPRRAPETPQAPRTPQAAEPPADTGPGPRTTDLEPPVVAVLPPSDPRFTAAPDGPTDADEESAAAEDRTRRRRGLRRPDS